MVFTLVERGGEARSFHVDGVRVADLQVDDREQHQAPKPTFTTDEAWPLTSMLEKSIASHESVTTLKDEYVRGNVYTNTVEGFYSIFKRGMKGIYQHCSEKHLHRYLARVRFPLFQPRRAWRR